MKMSDYFELPVSFDIDLCKIHSPSHNLIEAKAINLEAQCYAINNYDRITEENAKLLEMLERLVNPKNCKKDIIHIIGNAESLLNQLKDQNNDK